MQEQPSGRGGGASGGAGAGGDDCRDLFDVEMAAAHIEHGSNEVADHVVQKAVAADAVDQEIASLGLLPLPRRGEDGSNGCRLWRLRRGRFYFLVEFRVGIEAAGGQVGIGGDKAQEVVLAFE